MNDIKNYLDYICHTMEDRYVRIEREKLLNLQSRVAKNKAMAIWVFLLGFASGLTWLPIIKWIF